MLPIVQEHGYEFLLTRESLMGLKDREMIYPLLLAASENNIDQPFIAKLLKARGLEPEAYHPGYTLWVQTFGGFKVWRGDQPVDPEEWKREKARLLFQLLVGHRDKWLHRDQIISMLWPDTPLENANNYLKVILNTLNQVLEPDRPRGETAFFVERRQELYRLNPRARVMVDAELFTQQIGGWLTTGSGKCRQPLSGTLFRWVLCSGMADDRCAILSPAVFAGRRTAHRAVIG